MKNFALTYVVSLVLYLIVFVYIVLITCFLKKPKNISPDESSDKQPFQIASYLKQLFNFKNELSFFKDTLNILTKKRDNNSRFYLNLLFIIYFVGASIALGLGSIPYLYLIKKPISFTQTEYGIFKAVNIFTRTFALLIAMPLLKSRIPDYYLFVLGVASEVFNLVIYSSASLYSYLIWSGNCYYKFQIYFAFLILIQMIAPVFYMFSNYFVVFVRLFARYINLNE